MPGNHINGSDIHYWLHAESHISFLMMEKIKTGKKSESIAKTVVRLLMPYRKTVKTITTDNGSEFASHQLITKGLHMKGKDDVIVYFADAYSHQCRMYGRYPDDVIVYFADAYSSTSEVRA